MRIVFLVLVSLSAAALTAQAPAVVINEFAAKANPEWIELYNTTSAAVDLTGWALIDMPSDTNILSGSIPGNGYYLFTFSTNNLSNDGDVILLINTSGDTLDYIGYGYSGPAPVGIYNSNNPAWSTARITDGYYTSPNNAMDFNVDGTPTPNAANDASPAPLNALVCVNEIDPYGENPTFDSVEFYNSTSSPVAVGGWFLSDGDDFMPITGYYVIPAYGYLVLDSTDFGGINFSNVDLCYLFMPDTQRVDQLGWYNEYNDSTFQRVPDGAGPHDGYNWASSGGGISLFDKAETWGETNGTVHVVEEVQSPSLPEGYLLYCPSLSGKGGISIFYNAPGSFTLAIYSLDGRLVRDIYSGRTDDIRTYFWDLTDGSGAYVAQGNYILMLSDETQKLSLKLKVIY
ncbi:lamin tail domain-containing protein [candidate division WOR-3 bacterium]|nr:lamin tail domain-containing protein [candidate division WOR-3 bacterium]